MRDLFDDIRKNEPLDPAEAARRTMRQRLMRRFYAAVGVAEGQGGFELRLDDRTVKTPARRTLAAPTAALAAAIAAEWEAQGKHIDPASMPLTRLANTIIDGVADAPGPVAAEIEKYLRSDLVFYRAESPAELVARQAAAWDPLVAWARTALGARFVLAQGMAQGMAHVRQPAEAIAAACAALGDDPADPNRIWRLGALHTVTTLTGSALIALALLHRRMTVDDAWVAAHVDEDWTMEFWGRDAQALERRGFHFAQMLAAATVLDTLRVKG